VLTTIQVVLPPPPGAPNANPDSAEVKPGESVVIDVLANDANPAIEDTPRADLGAVTLPEIMNAPGEGTAEVNDDGTVTYTANADTTASGDSFDYRICSAFEQPEFAGRMGKAFAAGDQQPCDTTTVSIGITQAQATTAPTTAAPTTAPAGSVSETTDELPVTGSSSGPLGVLGFAAAIVGLGLLALSRRARTA
jgi:LPXTG-motif cell wall-anchored protein